MNLLERFKKWFREMFTYDVAEKIDTNPAALRREVLGEYNKQLDEIKRAMVHLVYERKNIESELENLKARKFELDEDLKSCLYENKDELGKKYCLSWISSKRKKLFTKGSCRTF